jgi:hypothetical protein
LNFQVCLGDHDARPRTTEQLVFGDHRSIGLQQDQQNFEGSCPQLYRHAVSDQLPLAPQYSESSEANDRVAVAVHPALIDLGQGD